MSARIVARNVDLIVHESGVPAAQKRGLSSDEHKAIRGWGAMVWLDDRPLVVQDTEVNEAEGITGG
jgi:hypothetical protein